MSVQSVALAGDSSLHFTCTKRNHPSIEKGLFSDQKTPEVRDIEKAARKATIVYLKSVYDLNDFMKREKFTQDEIDDMESDEPYQSNSDPEAIADRVTSITTEMISLIQKKSELASQAAEAKEENADDQGPEAFSSEIKSIQERMGQLSEALKNMIPEVQGLGQDYVQLERRSNYRTRYEDMDIAADNLGQAVEAYQKATGKGFQFGFWNLTVEKDSE